MRPVHRLSLVEQTAAHLREGIARGRWGDQLPGVLRLATELDVSKDTVRAALRQIEHEGVLAPAGHGRRRIVVSPVTTSSARRSLRVVILFRDPLEDQNSGMQRLVLQLQRRLESTGHTCVFAPKSQIELNFSVPRVARLMRAMTADAWLVVGGDLELLKWFAAQPVPALVIGGRQDLPMAGVGMDGIQLLCDLTRHLITLGHRRIVMVCPRSWRTPTPSQVVEAFMAELTAGKVSAGDYNIPDWQPTLEGFQQLLGSLFEVTPPTALIMEEPAHVLAVISHLAQRQLRIPQDVSLVSLGREASQAWCRPEITHFYWDNEQLLRRITRWVAAVAAGRPDREAVKFPLEFNPGATIAPPPGPVLPV